MSKKAIIFTGLVKIDSNLVGTAIIYLKILSLLVKNGYDVNIVVPEEVDLPALKKKIGVNIYSEKNNKELIDSADLLVFGAYPPISPLLYAYHKKKTILIYLWSIAPIGSLEFKDFADEKKQNRLHRYITASYNLSLLLSDKIFCRDNKTKDLIVGSLISLGRINLNFYKVSKNFSTLVEEAPFGIEAVEPEHKRNIYRNNISGIDKKDFLLIWNGGIWNWNDAVSLIKAMNVLKKYKDIKLIFQGYKHPSKWQKLSKEANSAIQLSSQFNLTNRNVFFIKDWLPYKERANYLVECDAGIITSPNIAEANYFLKTRIYDYLWGNLPVILNDSEAFAPIISRNSLGLLARTGDYKDLASKIFDLYRDKYLRRRIKINIIKFKKEIQWKKTLRNIDEYLKNPVQTPDKYNNDDIIKKEITINKEIIDKYENK